MGIADADGDGYRVIFPLGSVGARVRPPYLTLALIAINLVVHVAVHDRVAADAKALRQPMLELLLVESAIELEHRGPASVIHSSLGLERTSSRDSKSFWWRWEQGLVVPKDSESWQRREAARRAWREALRTTLHHRWGWRIDEPTLGGLIAHGFLHADFAHLLGNMLFLWAVGAAVEDTWGRKWLGLLYALGLLGSALADFLFVAPGLDIPGIGASGAVAAVMGAMAVRHFRRPMRVASMLPFPGIYQVATGWLLVPWIATQLVASAARGAQEAGVGYGAHVGGFAVGAAFAGLIAVLGVERRQLAPQREAEARETARRRHVKEADELFARGDSAHGIDALRSAIREEPGDLETRARLVDTLGVLARTDEQRAEGVELLQRLWRAGERERFAATWLRLGERAAPLPPALAHRAAVVLEPTDPVAAARAYATGLQDAPDDPLAAQSFKRYADLLERLGEPAKAAQVRELGARHERRRRDAGLA